MIEWGESNRAHLIIHSSYSEPTNITNAGLVKRLASAKHQNDLLLEDAITDLTDITETEEKLHNVKWAELAHYIFCELNDLRLRNIQRYDQSHSEPND